ncbi:DUF2487 family protein [Paenibacillus chitinolyticus]|uniref:DUF2487 family protein n=1 Tax=Paenibacillus chitinolyticus TaxID=79263 RepID=UPI00365EF7AC
MMKFSEITEKDWTDLQPYLDTCLLPVTGLGGGETPWEAGDALESLRDVLDVLEIPYKGRVVTYPALHYCTSEDRDREYVERTCGQLRKAGFAYVVVVTAHPEIGAWQLQNADLIVYLSPEAVRNPGQEAKKAIGERIEQLWFLKKSEEIR